MSDIVRHCFEGGTLESFAIYASMKAKAGKEAEVDMLLVSLLSYAEAERAPSTGLL